LAEVRQWLFNGWNTENLLRLTSDLLKDRENASALHWSFPQAYYSAYSVAFAWFKVAGYTERTHAAVIKKFGSQAVAGHYPPLHVLLRHRYEEGVLRRRRVAGQ
jgi:hypothetical protein